MSNKQSNDARSAAFNPQHKAFNPTSQQGQSGSTNDARAASFNPQHNAYNPNTKK